MISGTPVGKFLFLVSGPKATMLNITAPIAEAWGDVNNTVFPRMYFLDSGGLALRKKYCDCTGAKHEPVQAQGMNTGLLSALAEKNEVKAVFVGHNHVNEYCCLVHGVHEGGTGSGRAYIVRPVSHDAHVIEWTVDNNELHEIRS
ncbi:unnamed protein product [Peronospora destructor]|uniref:Calcineurin-like phosphoesterase domain-containing protein n=1 Tax=Peronospora destructor TaxID=86335 RepID=A0AAV0T4Q0_9STRA|nr:unnamed protein product [Peronospora destructor]